MDPGRTSGRVWLRSSAESYYESRDPLTRVLISNTNVKRAYSSSWASCRRTWWNGLQTATARSRSGPIGIGSSHSDSWPIRASGSSAKGVRFTSKDGLLPASTKRRTEAANVIGLKSWHVNSVCSATARMATRPRRKLPTTSHSSRAGHSGEPRKRFSLQPSTSQSEIMKMDIYAIVTEKIINLLESGVVPWRRPWTSTGLRCDGRADAWYRRPRASRNACSNSATSLTRVYYGPR